MLYGLLTQFCNKKAKKIISFAFLFDFFVFLFPNKLRTQFLTDFFVILLQIYYLVYHFCKYIIKP